MTHKERVLLAVNLKEPDRVPIDLGAHINSSIHRSAYAELKERMDIRTTAPEIIISRMMQDVAVEDPVLEALDIDTRGVFPGGPVNNGVIDEKLGTWIDEWGSHGSCLKAGITLSSIVLLWPERSPPATSAAIHGRIPLIPA